MLGKRSADDHLEDVRKMLKIEEKNKLNKNHEIQKKFCENISEEAESNFASLVIPKIESHHLLQPNPAKQKNPFLTWSSMTSAAPSPPAENVSTIHNQKQQASQGDNVTAKNVTIECDFTHIDDINYKHEDILILERFKEAIELLIIKVSFCPDARTTSAPTKL